MKTKPFSSLSINTLLKIINHQYNNQGHILGIFKPLFYEHSKNSSIEVDFYDKKIETPFGISSGPYGQLAQNILCAWLCGARYIELSGINVQITNSNTQNYYIKWQDEICYNNINSQLNIKQYFEECLKSWILLHIMKFKLWGNFNNFGTIFIPTLQIQSELIQNENIKWFFNKISNCREELNEKINEIKPIFPEISNININSQISNYLVIIPTFKTTIKDIYENTSNLLKESKFNIILQVNPLLLGKEILTEIINYKYNYPIYLSNDLFDNYIKYDETKDLINKLINEAKKSKTNFAVKISGNFEIIDPTSKITTNPKSIYIDGKFIHPLAILLAEKIQKDFEGKLDLLFSGGVDCYNSNELIACGFKTVSTSSDVLKPGGYGRLYQYIENLKQTLKECNSENINQFIIKKSNSKNLKEAIIKNLKEYSKKVIDDKRYHRDIIHELNPKTNRTLEKYDCTEAPCVCECPANQNIPEYMFLVSSNKINEAFKIIKEKTPFPYTLSTICTQLCKFKCIRAYYDEPIAIKEIKRYITQKANDENIRKNIEENNKTVAIIGAGPSGLACAYFLRLEGYAVDVYEAKYNIGGMLSSLIPKFSLNQESFEKDLQYILDHGIKIHYGHYINRSEFEKLRKKYSYIYVAIGAQKMKKLNIEGEGATGVIHPLMFLQSVREGKKPELGKHVVVVGGGNLAIDIARTALRLLGGKDKGNVTIIYKRTIKDMPVDKDKIKNVLNEGIQIIEQSLPVKILTNGWFVSGIECVKTHIVDERQSEKNNILPIPDSNFIIQCSSIIPAIGQEVVIDFIDKKSLNSSNYRTEYPNVFIGGEALRGQSNLITAINDGINVAKMIIELDTQKILTKQNENNAKQFSLEKLMIARSIRKYSQLKSHNSTNINLSLTSPNDEIISTEEAITEASRCLYCSEICNICVTVCPSRANIFYSISQKQFKVYNGNTPDKLIEKNFNIKQDIQVLNLADLCNECENCSFFCPTNGKPFKDKPRVFLDKEKFDENNHGCYIDFVNKQYLYKINNFTYKLKINTDKIIFIDNFDNEMYLNFKDLSLIKITKYHENTTIDTMPAIEILIIHYAIKNSLAINENIIT